MFRLGTTRQGKNNMHWVVRWSCQDPPKKGKQNIHRALKCSCQEQNKGTKKSSRKGIDRGDKCWCWERLEREGEIYSSRGQMFMPWRPKRIGTTHIFIGRPNVHDKNDLKWKGKYSSRGQMFLPRTTQRGRKILFGRPNVHPKNHPKGKETYSSGGQIFMLRTIEKGRKNIHRGVKCSCKERTKNSFIQ